MYSCAPSLAVPRPDGSSCPVGLIEISQARISSAVGDRPTPYVGDCADPIWHIPRKIIGRSLRKAIQHAPSLATFHGCTVLSLPRTRDFSGGSFQYSATSGRVRSEEHTSELQSLTNIV